MKKKVFYFMLGIIFLLSADAAVYAETGQKCAEDCVEKCSPLGSGKEYADCLYDCLEGCYDKPTGIPDVPPPQPANPSGSSSGFESNKHIIVASNYTEQVSASTEKLLGDSWYWDPKDETKGTTMKKFLIASNIDENLCCRDHLGRVIAKCHPLFPYYNILNGECYSTLEDCKKAAGGYDFCYTCSRCGSN